MSGVTTGSCAISGLAISESRTTMMMFVLSMIGLFAPAHQYVVHYIFVHPGKKPDHGGIAMPIPSTASGRIDQAVDFSCGEVFT